jgi:hypothetical protein
MAVRVVKSCDAFTISMLNKNNLYVQVPVGDAFDFPCIEGRRFPILK